MRLLDFRLQPCQVQGRREYVLTVLPLLSNALLRRPIPSLCMLLARCPVARTEHIGACVEYTHLLMYTRPSVVEAADIDALLDF